MADLTKQVETPPAKGFPKGILIVAAAAIVLLGLGGYAVQNFVINKVGKLAGEKAIESKTGAKVNINESGSFKVKSKEGEREGGTTASGPDDMHKIVPQFSFGTITVSAKVDNDGGKGWTIMAKDVEKNNFDSYIKDLESTGWVSQSTVSMVV